MRQQTEGNQFALQTIRDLREVDSVRQVWKSWQGTRDSDFDFFSGVVRSRGEHCKPYVAVLSRNGRPDALLLGITDRLKIPLRLGFVTVYQPEVKVLEFVYGGLLGNASSENCAALVKAVMHSLAEGEADVAFWQQLDVQSALYVNALKLPRFVSRDYSRCVQEHWFIRNPDGLDAFLSSLGRAQRSKLGRKYKRVLNSFAGRMQVRCCRTIADLEQAVADMEEIARKSVKRQLGFGFFDSSQTREQMFLEAARGWLRIYILYVEGKPVSFWKGTLYERCLQADHVGFDSTWKSFSPGIFLFLNILENLRDEDVETIDFGCGRGQLHECFGKVRLREARVQIYAPTFFAVQLNLLRTLTHYTTILIQGTHCLNWVRRAARKRRNAAALAQISQDQFRRVSNARLGSGAQCGHLQKESPS